MIKVETEETHIPRGPVLTYPRVGKLRAFLVLGLGLILILLIVNQAIPPIQKYVAKRFFERGNTYMLQLKFTEAKEEYQKALRLDGSLTEAAKYLQEAKLVTTDPSAARPFFTAQKATAWLETLDQAETEQTSPKEAVQAGLALLNAGKPALGRYALEQATRLDAEYAPAWYYLSKCYGELARLDPEFQTEYQNKADQALAKQKALAPAWEE